MNNDFISAVVFNAVAAGTLSYENIAKLVSFLDGNEQLNALSVLLGTVKPSLVGSVFVTPDKKHIEKAVVIEDNPLTEKVKFKTKVYKTIHARSQQANKKQIEEKIAGLSIEAAKEVIDLFPGTDYLNFTTTVEEEITFWESYKYLSSYVIQEP